MWKYRLATRGLGAVVAVVVALLVAACSTGMRVVPEDFPSGGAPVGEGAHVVAFIGDSWTAGAGARDGEGYAFLAGRELGWEYHVLGVHGSGYTRPGSRGLTYAQRIDAALATRPDVVVVQGSLNERRGSPELLVPAARDTLARLRAAAGPQLPILVLGASYNPGTPATTIDWINDAVRDAAQQAGARFDDVAQKQWTDPGDASLWADPIHPDDAGHRLIAAHLVQLLPTLVEDASAT